MNHFRYIVFLILSFTILSCDGQFNSSSPANKQIGGPYENAEFMDIKMPKSISCTDTSAGWKLDGQKLLITGTIYKPDGKTPAPGVMLYYYQTNTEGRYLHKPGEERSMPPNNLGQTHGYIRGWIRSDSNGRYSIYTVRPGVYPSRDEPAHIHLSIREPQIPNSYYIDDLVFDDDELLTTAKRKKLENRGGSGILRVLQKDQLQIAEHDIILGLNIPNYPSRAKTKQLSGLQIGEDQPSFIPYHAYGPDKGSRACPVCKYGRYHGIIYFVGNNPNWTDIKQWLTFLEQQTVHRSKYLKAYFVYGNDKGYDKNQRRHELEKLGDELNLKNLALTYVPSFTDTETEANLNEIDPSAENTFVIYKNRTIIDKYSNLQPTESNFQLISNLLDSTKGEYFHLNYPAHQ